MTDAPAAAAPDPAGSPSPSQDAQRLLDEERSRRSAAEAQLSSLTQELERLRGPAATSTDLAAQVADLQARLSHSQDEVQVFEGDMAQIRTQLAAAESAREALEAARARLDGELSQSRGQLSKAEGELRRAQEAHAASEEALRAAQARGARLTLIEQQLEMARTQLRDAQGGESERSTALSEARAEVEKWKAESTTLEERRAALGAELSTLREAQAGREKERAADETEMAAAQKELEIARREVAAVRTEVEGLRQELSRSPLPALADAGGSTSALVPLALLGPDGRTPVTQGLFAAGKGEALEAFLGNLFTQWGRLPYPITPTVTTDGITVVLKGDPEKRFLRITRGGVYLLRLSPAEVKAFGTLPALVRRKGAPAPAKAGAD